MNKFSEWLHKYSDVNPYIVAFWALLSNFFYGIDHERTIVLLLGAIFLKIK